MEKKLYSVKLHLQTHGFFYKSYYSNLELHVHVCYTQASLCIGKNSTYTCICACTCIYMYMYTYIHVLQVMPLYLHSFGFVVYK